jgi:ribonuclease HII
LGVGCDFGEGWVKASEIDSLGLAKALRVGVGRALKSLAAELDEDVIIDGKVNYLPKKFINGRALIDADNLIPVVSAASIYAKVSRDKYMAELAQKYPLYKFEDHVGYGTKAHLLALKSHGALKGIHRFSYQPIARLVRV